MDKPNWKTPQMFPRREPFMYNPGIPDRQLWAIGMLVVQWSMFENLMHNSARNLCGSDKALFERYQSQPSIKHWLTFHKSLVDQFAAEPLKTKLLALHVEAINLKDQRDKVVHGMWGGGIPGESWSNPEKHPETDGRLLPGAERRPVKWNLTVAQLRDIAAGVAALNAKFASAIFGLG